MRLRGSHNTRDRKALDCGRTNECIYDEMSHNGELSGRKCVDVLIRPVIHPSTDLEGNWNSAKIGTCRIVIAKVFIVELERTLPRLLSFPTGWLRPK